MNTYYPMPRILAAYFKVIALWSKSIFSIVEIKIGECHLHLLNSYLARSFFFIEAAYFSEILKLVSAVLSNLNTSVLIS